MFYTYDRMRYSFLSTFGLTEKEIALYELLLSHGKLSAGDIVKESKLKRPTVYQSLYVLQKKGLVTQFESGKKIHFKVEPPTKLLDLANNQLKNVQESHKELSSLISNLNSQYILSVEKPVIAVFEGVEGLKEIYDDMLTVGKPIFAALTTDEVDPQLYKWLTTVFAKKRAELKITAEVLVASGENTQEYVSKNRDELRQTKTVDKTKYPFQHEIDIYGDKIAFVNYKKGEHLIGVVVQNPFISKTMKALFDVAWDGA